MPSLRSIPSTMDAAIVARIDTALGRIEQDEDVRLLLAVESGSRAWGFPSPDSDYDCRFVYARPLNDYLSPWPRRDVIELPLVDDLDVNGWDLAKALKLLLKGNAVIIEWLTSPLVYRGDASFRTELTALAERVAERNLVMRHYLHLGEEFRRRHLFDPDAVALKKLFYALRPAAAIRWLAGHPQAAVAPMHFPTLMAECDAPAEVGRIVADLLQRKAVTRELGSGVLPAPIAAFIDAELEWARANATRSQPGSRSAAQAECEAWFVAYLRRLDGGAPIEVAPATA